MKNELTIIILLLLFASCSTRNLVYFSDLHTYEGSVQTIKNLEEPVIQPIDLLSIVVSTLNPESNLLFNSGVMTSIGSAGATASTPSQNNEGYRVDSNGFINFPVLGKVHVAGLTLEQASEKLTKLLAEEAINPIVNIKLLNFRITVIGEVNSPNTFPVLTERINLIEAIGLAGDLTAFGKRENVLLIREVDGMRSIVRLNLNQKSVLESPYFYLKQNDIVYVEPTKQRAEQATLWRQNLQLGLSILSIFVIVFLNTF